MIQLTTPSITSLTTPQPSRHSNPTVKAQRLAYLVWERPDLVKAKEFLEEFGLHVLEESLDAIYFRGTAAAPFCYVIKKAPKARFVGFALEVTSMEDLEKLSQLPEASQVRPLDTPGGGFGVSLNDPSGASVQAVFGQQTTKEQTPREVLNRNTPRDTPRINATQRVPVEAPDVIKLGHVVFELADFQATCEWYTKHFGFIPSDVQVLPDGSPAVTFLRLDLGDTPADHHTLALAQGLAAEFSHCAFELLDEDAVGMGQRVLRERRYKHAWGIGRHILGSQIFDYWEDPWGCKHEHYCDGDLFTSTLPMGVHAVSREAMSQWGTPMPASFVRPKLRVSTLVKLAHNLQHSPDITVKKLRMLAKAML